jgi:aerobic-type carbon monoxide dehydrogenase small subunit (CoxS/CutS family)
LTYDKKCCCRAYEKPISSQEEINGIDDNLCRCGANTRIIQTVETAATEMKEGNK